MARPTTEPLGLQLTRTAKVVSRAFDDALVEAGGSLPTWLVLVSLKGQRHGMQRELAEAVGIEGPTLTHHLNRMEAAGLVTRSRDPENRRIHRVELTDEGEAAFQRLRHAVVAFDRRLQSGVTEEQARRAAHAPRTAAAQRGQAGGTGGAGPAMTTTAARLERLTARTDPPPVFRLRGSAHKIALTAHILASVGWFGIAVVIAFCGIGAAATTDRSLAVALYRTMETAPWLSIPAGLIAVATGGVLGLGTAFGVIRHWWVVAKILIAVAVIATDALLVGHVAHDAAATGEATAPLYGSTIAHVVVLGTAAVLSVFEPRGRTPWGTRPTAPPLPGDGTDESFVPAPSHRVATGT